MSSWKVGQEVLDKVFYTARSYRSFQNKAVPKEVITKVIDLATQGPTAFNSLPARFVVVQSAEAKAKLAKCVVPGNVPAVESSPASVIIGYDEDFCDLLAKKLSPGYDAAGVYKANPDWILPGATYNASLQAGYFILACRMCGLDCGPMTGFDPQAINDTFFKDTKVKSQVVVNIGYGVEGSTFPRLPRPDFDDVAQIV